MEILILCSSITKRDSPRDGEASTPRTENFRIIHGLELVEEILIVTAASLQCSAFYFVEFTIVRIFEFHISPFPFRTSPGFFDIVMLHILALSLSISVFVATSVVVERLQY